MEEFFFRYLSAGWILSIAFKMFEEGKEGKEEEEKYCYCIVQKTSVK